MFALQVLFPLITDLGIGNTTAGVHSTGERLIDMEEQRMALASTLTRTFKHHIKELAALSDFHSLWLKLVRGRLRLGLRIYHLWLLRQQCTQKGLALSQAWNAGDVSPPGSYRCSDSRAQRQPNTAE